MKDYSLFRLSVVAPIVLSRVAVIYSILEQGSFSQDWQDILAWNGDEGFYPVDPSTAPLWTWFIIGVLELAAVVAVVNQVLFLLDAFLTI
jgi:hypothetical protein